MLVIKVDKGFALPVEMAFHNRFRRIGVATAQRIQDFPMLADGFIETPIFVNLLVTVEGGFSPQLSHDVVQNAVAGQFLDQGMKNVVDGNVLVPVALSQLK